VRRAGSVTSQTTEPMAYVGKDVDGDWMLFMSWQHAANTTGYTHFVPASQAEIYFAKKAGRVIPEVRERLRFRAR
jgi:hypothetical protein